MRASVVVPTLNSKDLLKGCLLAFQHQVLTPGDSFEVVLVDDGSTDGTGQMVQGLTLDYDLRYHFKPRTADSCRAAARNAGIERAEGDVVIMVDGDEIVPPGFVAEHLRAHRHHDDLVVIGYRDNLTAGAVDIDRLAREFSLDALPPVDQQDERATVMAEVSENLQGIATRWHFLYTCNASVRREHLVAVGGFDEEIKRWSMEDVDLGYRLHKRGLVFVYQPYAVLYHQHHPISVSQQYEDWRHNSTYLSAKHPELEVTLQWVMNQFFDADHRTLGWTGAYMRFEYSVRALQGRLPMTGRFEVVRVVNDPADALNTIGKRMHDRHLVVIDQTTDRDLPLQVQQLASPNELWYFKRPEAAEAAALADRFS